MEMIPVVFGIDKSYVLQAFVVMASILKSSLGQYHFFILTKDDMELDINELSESLRKYSLNFALSIRKIKEDILSNVKICNPHLTQAAFYRLLIPELIIEYEKCIYLDCDILVNGDLQELFYIDLENNYLGGVKDCHIISKRETRHQRYLSVPSVENYINSGVLLMNLKKIQVDGLASTFLAQAQKENLFEDQDVLNLCCYGFIKILPLRYNLFHFYQGASIKELFDLPYEKGEFMFDWKTPFILHMGGQFKPWADKRYKGAKEWWRIAEIYKESNVYQAWNEKCGTGYGEAQKVESIFDICRNREYVILWGYSDQGRDVCDLFTRKGIEIFSFCDNDRKKEGKIYRGIPVRNLQELMDHAPKAIWIITCKRAYKAVSGQLLESGIREEDIIHFTYNNKGKMYYLALDKNYYEEEIKTIALCENDGKLSKEEYLEYIRKLLSEANIRNREYQLLYYKYRFDLWWCM